MLKGFWIRNFKTLRQVGIGTCHPKFVFIDDETTEPFDLGPLTLFTGVSGTGKSSVVDAFNFISDCYRHGVEYACIKRGGFDAIYSQGSKGALTFGFEYLQEGEGDIATYALSLYRTKNKIPYIESEALVYRREDESLPVIFLQNGAEKSIRYLAPDERITAAELTKIEFTDHAHLGLAALPAHPKFPVLTSFRSLFENWALCDFTPDPARGLDHSHPRRHDSPYGVSLSGLIRHVSQKYRNQWKPIFHRVASAIPNVERILLDTFDPEKPTLTFQLFDRETPIPITHLSASTIRLFTYKLLLEIDEPAPLTILEEPENGLDRMHLTNMVEALRRFVEKSQPESPQVFMTTNHPAVLDGVHPSHVWILEKDREGFTIVERASDSMSFNTKSDTDEPQWFSKFFDAEQ